MNSRLASKLASPFGVLSQIWLTLFSRSLQVVSKPSSNARSCGTRALHDIAQTTTSGI
jgi:hypothetical protein